MQDTPNSQTNNSNEPLEKIDASAVSPAPARCVPSGTFHDEAHNTETSSIDTMPSLEELLRQAELTSAEHHDAWLRAKAETENVRRRALEDVARAGKFAVEKFATELLAVKDSLEAALANENQNAENLKAGVELTLKQLSAAFEKSHLVEISPLGEKFDPHKHQAISQTEAEGEPNQVLSVLQKGYTLHDRVIRPALVIVSKAK
ncbi:molecular chaperone GrpE [Rugosibacter aromaticivorans]|uniref:Protein GrpE n=1 Tax=Rugosibacter aromaticivorans TaxID=1565605 RepID=A0A0C5J8P4_9PROT|nr:nucleotide exchange factor GrpE [Rugosibacter aromaticivorans]AJP48088.1 molecular chaperone GrpE [Rugosibacter aromaticivorans]